MNWIRLGVGAEWNKKDKRYIFRRYVPGAKGRKSTTKEGTARSEIEARTRYKEWLADLEVRDAPPPPPGPPPIPTLREFVESQAWRDAQDIAKMKPGTRAFYKYAMATVLPIVGDVKLDEFTASRVEGLALALTRAGKSETTSREYAQAVLRIVRAAVDREVLPDNPVRRRVHLPEAAKPTGELSADERVKLLAALEETPALKALIVFDLATGLRRSDVLGLRWGQVDWENETITVVQKKTGKPVTLPLSSAAMEALEWCRSRGVRSMQGLVFLDHRGKAWSDQVLKDAWAAAKKRAGIAVGRKLRLHDLRHSYACALADAGVALPIIAGALGHSGMRSVGRYARASSSAVVDTVREAQRRMEAEARKR